MSQLGDRDKVVNAFLEEEPSQDENAGTFFDVVFIPAPISSADECNLLMEDAMVRNDFFPISYRHRFHLYLVGV